MASPAGRQAAEESDEMQIDEMHATYASLEEQETQHSETIANFMDLTQCGYAMLFEGICI